MTFIRKKTHPFYHSKLAINPLLKPHQAISQRKLVLVEALKGVPDIGTFATRTTLLSGVPDHLSLERDEGNTHNDLSLIISQLFDNLVENTGEYLLKIFMDNAKNRVRGWTLYGRLENLYQQYKSCPVKRKGPVILNDKVATKRSGKSRSPAYQLYELHSFDLDSLVMIFLTSVRESQNRVGFAISCDYPKFLEIFRKRIEDTIRGHRVFKGTFLWIERSYMLKYDTIRNILDDIKNRTIKTIQRYVFVPIRLGNNEGDQELAQMFWTKINEERMKDTRQILIVVLLGRSRSAFPEDMIPLVPSFAEKDVHEWMLDISTRLAWPLEEVKMKWKAHMLAKCSVDQKRLDMESTYVYVNEVKDILRNNAILSFGEFWDQLEKRSMYL